MQPLDYTSSFQLSTFPFSLSTPGGRLPILQSLLFDFGPRVCVGVYCTLVDRLLISSFSPWLLGKCEVLITLLTED